MKEVTIHLKENTYQEIEKIFEDTKKELSDFDKNEFCQFLLALGLEFREDFEEVFFPEMLSPSKPTRRKGFIYKIRNLPKQDHTPKTSVNKAIEGAVEGDIY